MRRSVPQPPVPPSRCTATPTVPGTVSYELTDLGLSLHQMMRALKTWAETHMDDVLANRETYDKGQPA